MGDPPGQCPENRDPPFSFEESRELLTDPLQHARDRGAAGLSRFDAAFWGTSGVAYIHHETAGWPNFVQLLAQKSVYLANERGITQVTADILDAAAAESLVSGENAFHKILVAENRLPGEWDYLLGFREREVQPPPEDFEMRRSLRRRLLVVDENGLWRMRVPLMRRWLIERA